MKYIISDVDNFIFVSAKKSSFLIKCLICLCDGILQNLVQES